MPRRTTSPGAKLVTAKDASIETGIAYTTLRDLVFRGELPVVRIGRAWYFNRDDLDRWITEHTERYA
jgi:excisionase family DNA binding protein